MSYKPAISNPLTAFGELRTAELSPVFQNSFEYTVDNTDLTTSTVTTSGTVTQADAMAVITSSATPTSSAMLQSHNHARYRSGQGALSRFTALFTTPTAVTEQLAGLADETGSSEAFENGYMIGYIGTTFGFHRFVNDSIVTVAQSAWDDPMDGTGASGMTLDQTKLNVYELQFQYLGAGAITVWIEDDSTGEFAKVHTVLYANTAVVPSTYMPNFFMTYWVDNKATSANLIIKSASYAYFTEGKTELIQIHQPQFATPPMEKLTVTTAEPIFTIRNRSTYASKTNFIDVVMERFGGSLDTNATNNLGLISLVKGGTLGGSPSWTDVSTSNSVIEYDNSATSVSGGTPLAAIPLAGKSAGLAETILDLKIIISPGETISIVGSSGGSATVAAGCLWKELF